MKKKDYYLILGVPRTGSAEEIKAAFRKLAKEYHPDKKGPEGTRFFQELAEAYGVLSDAGARAEYTEALRRTEEGGRGNMGRGPAPGRSFFDFGADLDFGAEFAEDIFSELRKSPRFSSLDDVFLEILRASPFTGPPPRRDHYDLELILSAEEARTGADVSAKVPIPHECPECAGSGGTLFSVCRGCGGTGSLTAMADIRVSVPPGVAEGTVLHAPVYLSGSSVLVRMHVRID